MKWLFIGIGIAVLALVAWAALRPSGAPHGFSLPQMTGDASAPSFWPDAPTPAAPADESVPADEFADIPLDQDAIASLRGGRIFGDPRTPPIGHSAPEAQASAEELADPEKYAEFESRQERKLKRAYVIEAEKYVAQLREDIERGKSIGIPADEIAKVREKVRRIEEMRAQLLAADPQLLDSGSPVPPRAAVQTNAPKPGSTGAGSASQALPAN